MDTTTLPSLDTAVSRIGLGTWTLDGWQWDEDDSESRPTIDEQTTIDTIVGALESGINVIDTAPVDGRGAAEPLVGAALAEYGRREEVVLTTKTGLDRNGDGTIVRNADPDHIRAEVINSLERLNTDYVDLYQVHWPDPLIPIDETAGALRELRNEGLIRAIGVNHFSPSQMDTFRRAAPLSTYQSAYSLFERGIEDGVRSYCQQEDIGLLTYGTLCRGILNGNMQEDRPFQAEDLRETEYLEAVDQLDQFARTHYGKRALHLAVRWVLDQGIDVALLGTRVLGQLDPMEAISGWSLTDEDMAEIDRILANTLSDSISPAFMAPPARDEVE